MIRREPGLGAASVRAVEALKPITGHFTMNGNPTHKAEKAHACAMEPSSFSFVQGSLPGHDSNTGFPVRSHHLSGLFTTPTT
jgi:hypothetical protein